MANTEDAPAWRELYDYWRSRHVNGQPPGRDTLDLPIDLPHLAPDLMLVDVLPRGFAYRLAGSNVVKGAGVGMTGIEPGTSGRYAHVMGEWTGAIRAVHDDGKPRLLTARFATHVTAKTIWLLLPLSAAADGIPKILGGLFLEGVFAPGTDIEAFAVNLIDP
jgi:hypothetical protein